MAYINKCIVVFITKIKFLRSCETKHTYIVFDFYPTGCYIENSQMYLCCKIWKEDLIIDVNFERNLFDNVSHTFVFINYT